MAASRVTVRVVCVVLAVAALAACSGTTEGARPSPTATTAVAFDVDAARAEQLSATATMFGLIDPPSVAVVREIAPEEQPRVQADCMTDQGFRPNDEGMFDYTNEQTSAVGLALYRCTAMYPLAEKYVRPLSPDQVKVVYTHYVDSLVPCLTGEGYAIPAPPTWQTYIATGGTVDEYSPYGFLPDLAPDALARLLERCPQFPSSELLYGEG